MIADTTYSAAGDPAIAVGQPLSEGGNAIADGKYPQVFNNDSVDGSFAVSTPLDLLDVDQFGNQLLRVKVPADQVTTSFSSKSEGAINFSTDGQDLSWSGDASGTGPEASMESTDSHGCHTSFKPTFQTPLAAPAPRCPSASGPPADAGRVRSGGRALSRSPRRPAR